ncbi:MAG: hypothetical protein U0234_05455 [Sandaracinus sp.]
MTCAGARLARRAAFVLVVLVAGFGCAPFDTTRVPATNLTVGQEIVRTFCERMAAEAHPNDVSGLTWKPVCRGEVPPPDDAPPRLVALMANRDRLAGALDSVMPEDTHDDLGQFLGDMLPFYDPPRERLPTNTRLLATVLERVAADDHALDALARIGARTGYRPLRLALGVIRPILSYPEFDHFAEVALRALTDLPDDLPGGTTDGVAADELVNVEGALALYLASMQPADPLPAGERSTLQLSRDLLFTTNTAFGSGTSHYVVLRDDRGIALPVSGTVAAPFADVDGDGLADVDRLGRFVDDTGALLDLPRPFALRDEGAIPRDSGGRALTSAGLQIYEYLNADETMLAGVVREGLPWFRGDHPTVLDLTRGLPTLLGARATSTHRYGMATLTYPGFDTSTSSAVDVVYGLGSILALDETEPLLEATEILLRDHEGDAAGVVDSAHYLLTQSDLHPEAQMAQPNEFWDDMTDVAIAMSHRPGMLEAVIRSFADPRSAQLGEIYGNMMRYRDSIDYDPANVNGTPIGFPLDQPVDRTQPDIEGNESLFERSIALIDGLNGVEVCNREGAVLHISVIGINVTWPLIGSYSRCELMRIPNVAEAYSQAILGRYTLPIADSVLNAIMSFLGGVGINPDDVLEQSSGIHGLTRHPTPQALNRLVFWGTQMRPDGQPNSLFVHDLIDPVVDRHGQDVARTYHGTIFAWEQPGFYEGMTPLLTVLHDPRWTQDGDGEYAFGRLLGTIYGHWPSPGHWHTSSVPGSMTYNAHDDGRSYEELLASGFVEGQLVRNLVRASQTLDGIDVRGQDGLGILAAAAEHIIDPDRNPGLTSRSGATSYPSNGGTRTMDVSPLQLVLESLRNVDRDWAAADPDIATSFHRGRDALTLQLLDTDTLGTSFTFHNQRGRALVLTLLPFLRERIRAHAAAGDLPEWAAQQLPNDTADTIGGPIVGGLVNLLDRIQTDPEARDALVALVAYLVDEASDNDAFLATLYAAADLLQVFGDDADIVPIAHALSSALAPNALDLVTAGGTDAPDVTHGTAYDALGLVRELQGIDSRHVLHRLLSNLVALPADGSEETPLEVILDVLSQINRTTPGDTSDYTAGDYREALGQASGFMRDDRRGMERLYQVLQHRVCFQEHDDPCDSVGATRGVSSELCGNGSCVCIEAEDGVQRWSCDIAH